MSKRVTPWHRPIVTVAPWEGSVLVQADASFVPVMIAELEPRKAAHFYPTNELHRVGYDAVCKTQEALLMDVYTGLVREIRALRGVDELDAGYDDPATDPFSLRMGHIEKVAVELEGSRALLQEIRDQLANQQSPEELADIVEQLGQIALLLG